jgi:RsiW-degrading membrane proteinase PrsW (M82 family)
MLADIINEMLVSNIPGFLFSVLIPLIFLIIMVKDKSSKYLMGFFCYGIFSVVFAFILNQWFSNYPGQINRVSSDIAPIVEETVKALPLLLFFRKSNFNDNLIIYCAMACGIGFSIHETLFYFTSFVSLPGLFSLFPLIVRTTTTSLMHGMSTAIIGFGVKITKDKEIIKLPMILGLIAISATIHSLYNILIGTRLAIFALLMPAAFWGLPLCRIKKMLKEGNNEA